MSSKAFLLVIPVLLLLGLLVACGTPAVATPPATEAPAAVPGETQAATEAPTSAPADECAAVPTPSVDVSALITGKLQNHHAEDRIYSAVHTREEWNTTLDRMIGYGAVISEEEKQVIIDYLLCFKP